MKNHGLIQFTKILMMWICLGVLSCLPAQSQKISLDKTQLVELTKKAEKATLYEDENTKLIVENYNLKQTTKQLTADVAKAQAQAATYKKQRNQNRYALAALLVAIGTSIFFRLKKHFR